MPIDSIAGLRHLSQAQGSFVRLDQSTDKLQTTTAKARFWQLSQRSQEKAGNRAAAERVRDSVCAFDTTVSSPSVPSSSSPSIAAVFAATAAQVK